MNVSRTQITYIHSGTAIGAPSDEVQDSAVRNPELADPLPVIEQYPETAPCRMGHDLSSGDSQGYWLHDEAGPVQYVLHLPLPDGLEP